jgi:hypothetical protein
VANDGSTTAHSEARRLLELFASVGATHFTVSWTNVQEKARRPRTLRKTLAALGGPTPKAENEDWLDAVHIDSLSHDDISRTIPALLTTATAERLNLIIRPSGPGVWFIQLDDLKAEQMERLAPRIFLTLETSPGNYQAWLALAGQHDKEFARRVRRGAGTDKRATGATRIAGSLNFKEKYAPSFPRVAIRMAQPGRTVTASELEELGLVAAKEEFAPFTPPRSSGSPHGWPDYEISLRRAPLNRAGTGPDRSNADLKWAMTAIGLFRRSKADAAAQLMEVSERARKRGRSYANMIAETAERYLAERQQQPPATRHRQG